MTARITAWEPFGSDVRSDLRRLAPDHIARLGWGPEEVEAAPHDGLRQLVATAVERSPFHRRRLAGVDVDHLEPSDLSSLPVMTKADLMGEFDDVLTDPTLSLAEVEEALAATGLDPVTIDDRYLVLASGGSSGVRGVFVLDRAALTAFSSSLSRPLLARLGALGGPPPGGLHITLVAAASAVHATGMAPAITAAGDHPFHFHPVPSTLPVKEAVARLNALQPAALFGYPSMISRLAVEKREGRLEITPFAITSTSENLLPEVAATITEAFGVPVANTFGSTEGLIGNTADGADPLTFNSDLCIVEPVDHEHRPVPPGTPSDKVLITNLYNRVQPLIRYELNDSFTVEPGGGFLRPG